MSKSSAGNNNQTTKVDDDNKSVDSNKKDSQVSESGNGQKESITKESNKPASTTLRRGSLSDSFHEAFGVDPSQGGGISDR